MKNYRCPLCQLPNFGKSHRVGGVWRCPKRVTLTQEAERFRNGRTTVEAIVTAPDYAEKIASDLMRHSYRELQPRRVRNMLVEIATQAAREGYNLGLGVQS